MSICNVAHLTHQFDEKILYQDAEFELFNGCLLYTSTHSLRTPETASMTKILTMMISGMPVSGSKKIRISGGTAILPTFQNSLKSLANDISVFPRLCSWITVSYTHLVFCGKDKMNPIALVFEIDAEDTKVVIRQAEKIIKARLGKSVSLRVGPHGSLLYYGLSRRKNSRQKRI